MKRREFDEVVRMVERIKSEKWDSFRDRYGDWGRDLALWAGRRYCGMKLCELASRVGGLRDSAVTGAVKHLECLSRKHREIRRAMKAVAGQCEL